MYFVRCPAPLLLRKIHPKSITNRKYETCAVNPFLKTLTPLQEGFWHGRRDFGPLSMSLIDFYGDFTFSILPRGFFEQFEKILFISVFLDSFAPARGATQMLLLFELEDQ